MFPGFEPVNAYIGLTAVLVNLTLAAWVILRSTRSHVYLTFMFVCLSVAFWNFSDFMIYATGHGLWPPAGEGHPSPWKYVGSSGSAMAVAFLFHFMCALVRGVRRWQAWIGLGYVAAGFFAVTSPMAIFYDPVRSFVNGAPWNIMFGVVLVPFIIAGLVMLVLAMVHAETAEEKNRWLFTITAIGLTVVTGLTDLVQKLNFPIPPLGHAGAVIGPTILAAGIVKHRKVFDVLTKTRFRLSAMSEMAAGIAHEIRNPLTALKGAVTMQAAVLKEGKPESAEKYRAIIAEEIQRLDQVLGSFQDFTRPMKLEKAPGSINDVIDKTAALARLEGLAMEIKCVLDTDIPAIEFDPALLKQVFFNFMRNAWESGDGSGGLVISTSWSAPWIVIDFEDDGPGVPVELQDRVFEPFFTTKKEGIGVGLAVCRRIVEAHNGRVELVSGSAVGAHFRIHLPCGR